MRRALLCLPFLLLTACAGSGDGNMPAATAAASSSAYTVGEYADEFVSAFQDTYGTAGTATGGTGTDSDWSAFPVTLAAIEIPEGYTTDANQVTAVWQSYSDARASLTDTCANAPGSGECYGAAFDLARAWQEALARSYEIPGVYPEDILV